MGKSNKWLNVLGLVSLFVGLVGVDLYFSFLIGFDQRVLPNTRVAGIEIGMMKFEEAEKLVKEKVLGNAQNGVVVEYDGKSQDFDFSEIGGFVDFEGSLGEVELLGQNLKRGFLTSFFVGDEIDLRVNMQEERLVGSLDLIFGIDGLAPKNAYVKLGESGDIEIIEGKSGLEFNQISFVEDVEDILNGKNSGRTIGLSFQDSEPTVVKADLEKQKDLIQAKLEKNLELKVGEEVWDFSLKDRLHWLRFIAKDNTRQQASTDPVVDVNFEFDLEDRFVEAFLKDEVMSVVERPMTSVKILKDENGKIVFDGKPQNGVKVILDEAVEAIENSINHTDEESVELPVREIAAKVEIGDESLKKLGINELVSTGYTTYFGSPYNRVHNIDVGIAKYNGLVLAPGESFSFNEHLGPVDARAGYRPELVIKGDETIPEYGGGLCQVSTTFYRAALYGGLPIEKRDPHSYAVSYYAQVGGHGLDATIYPDAGKDVVVKNNTPGHLLIQSYTEGKEAYFHLYGSNDGRSVEMEGPFTSNWRGPGPAVIQETNSLAPGARKQVSGSHSGFDTVWYRTIRKDGEEQKETIVSNYRAVPAKFLVGRAVATGEGAAE